jgi:hypothetical protein
MANPEQVALLKQDVQKWNEWRRSRRTTPDLSLADLSTTYLVEADLSEADLREANLGLADLKLANLSGANLSSAVLCGAAFSADLRSANLSGANLRGAYLGGTDLNRADLSGANLNGAILSGTDLSRANLSGADMTDARFGWSTLGDLDLSYVKGLDTVRHDGPSSIGIDTVYRSKGKIPESFLRGAGVPDSLITYMRSLTVNPIELYSCFISHSTKDHDFAERLYADLQARNVRCWFAPHDIAGGKKIHDQIDAAIHLYDRLLLVLSSASMDSEWVKTEIAKARKREVNEKRQMLFPVRLVEFEALRDWECFDSDTGKDSAREIREYFIPDFSRWKDHDTYIKAFDRLLRDLKSSDTKTGG